VKSKFLIATVVFGLALLAVALFLLRWQERKYVSVEPPAVLMGVRQLKQLVTVRYSIQRVVGITEPRVPLGSESVLLMVQGEVSAGVDLAELQAADIRRKGSRAMVIRLPGAKLLDAFLDEKHIKVWDHQITWWTPWVSIDPDLEHRARLQALDDVRAAALEMGILDQAQNNAQTAIRDFLAALNMQVTFEKSSS